MNISKFLAALFFTSSCFAQHSVDWKLKKSKDGIEVYTQLLPNSDYKSIRIIAEFQSTLPVIVKLITDADSHYKWINNCIQSKLLKTEGDSLIVFYEKYFLPWPASDRDLIIQTKIKYNANKTAAILTATTQPNYIPENKGVVRIPEFEGSWKLITLPNGSVRGEYTASINLGGYIPAWLVNLFITNGPYDSFVNLKKILAGLSD